MKAKNKTQQNIQKWCDELQGKSLTKTVVDYAIKNTFYPIGIESRGTIICGVCGEKHYSKNVGDSCVCPHCRKALSIRHNHRKLQIQSYFTTTLALHGYQVVRWFVVTKNIEHKNITHDFLEIGQHWVYSNGTITTLALSKNMMSYYCTIPWNLNGTITLKSKDTIYDAYVQSSACYCQSILPILKRNGYSKEHSEFPNPQIFISYLLKYNWFESAYKNGHYGYCIYTMQKGHDDGLQYHQIIKCANRKGFKFKTTDLWNDYLDYYKDIQYLGKDIHNPQIMIPDDFDNVHMTISHLAQNKREKERIRQEIERQTRIATVKEQTPEFQKWMSLYGACFNGSIIKSGSFVIQPLITRDDFMQESSYMHHCIMSYYGKQDTLLLSISSEGQKIETAEICLKKGGEIIQCRGVCNKNSDYHDEILSILKMLLPEYVAMGKRMIYKHNSNNTSPCLNIAI